MSLRNGHLGDDGWVMVWPSKERLAEETGRRRSTVKEHLAALEALGAIRRSRERVNGRTGVLWVRPTPALLAHLEARPEVQATLRQRFKRRYDPQVTPIESRFFLAENSASTWPENRPQRKSTTTEEEVNSNTPQGRRAEDRTPLAEMAWPEGWDEGRFARWFEYTHDETVADVKSIYARMAELRQTQDAAEDESAEAREKRLAKPKSQRMNGGRKQAPKVARTDTASALMRDFKALVTTNFPNAYNPPNDVKALSQMRMLLDRYGEAEVRRLMEFVADPTTWGRIKTKWPKIELFQPTPGWLLAWSESLLQWMKSGAPDAGQATGPKRSGGAEVYDRATTDAKGRSTF